MAWEGRLERDDLETGLWVLVTSDGRRIALAGDVPDTLRGKQVEVEGRRSSGLGLFMTGGTVVEVSRVTEK